MQTPSLERERHSWVIAIPPYASSISRNIFHPGFRRIFVLGSSFGLKHSSYFQWKSLLRNIFGYHWKSVKRGHDVNKKIWVGTWLERFVWCLFATPKKGKTKLAGCNSSLTLFWLHFKGLPYRPYALFVQTINKLLQKRYSTFILIKASSEHQMIAVLGRH